MTMTQTVAAKFQQAVARLMGEIDRGEASAAEHGVHVVSTPWVSAVSEPGSEWAHELIKRIDI